MNLKIILAVFCALIGLRAGAQYSFPFQYCDWITIAGLVSTPAYADGTNNAAFFNNPQGLAVDGAGSIFVADASNYVIRKISPIGSNWVTTTIAGLAGTKAFADGTNNTARFSTLTTIQIDGVGNLYVQDYNSATGGYYIRKITLVGTNWVVSTIYKLWNSGSGWAVDPSGNYYTSSNYAIVELSPSFTNGILSPTNFIETTLAGFPGLQGFVDGAGIMARFYKPFVFAVDSSGTIYLTDSFANGSIIRIVAHEGGSYVSSTINWTPPSPYSASGSFNFNSLDYAGNIFTTFYAYSGYYGIFYIPAGTQNGVIMAATGDQLPLIPVGEPTGIAVGESGTVFGADSEGSTIWEGLTGSPVLGSMQVILESSNAVSAGAEWRVDAGFWQTNGATVTNLLAGGNHVLSFLPVFGWESPPNQWVTISSNATATVEANYSQEFGELQVNLTPAAATNAGAQWSVDGGAWLTSGTILSNLPIGIHAVTFTNLAGFITPVMQTNVNILWNQTTVIAGNYVALGAVEVTVLPTNAVTGGAQWSLDGGGWQTSGGVLSNLALGIHTISFLPLSSWITPSIQTVNVVSGQITNLTAIYTALGSVQVFITPIGAVSAGAAWRADGGAWQTSGIVVSNLVAGNHTLAFTNITGWTAPTNQIVVVNLNQTTTTSGIYVEQFGNLQVALSPAGAVSESAKWQMDGGAWQESGATLTNVTVGPHTVFYAAIAGWTAPASQPVTINSNQTTRLTAIYQGEGSLQVLLVPTGAVVSGALWQVDRGAWLSNGMVASGLSLGAHTVSFLPVSGWVAPANQSVSIFANQETATNGIYTGLGYSFTTIAGAVGTSGFVDGIAGEAIFDTPVGICTDISSNLYIADTGNSVIRKLTPTASGWVSSTLAGLAGYPGNADGTNSQARFNYPSGVAIDTNGNLYVADQVNSTVRKMTPTGTNWVVSTIAGLAGNYGSANGTNGAARFYYPSGVTVDAAGNVYVADQINCTIRKLTPLGSNNWAVTTIAGTNGLSGSIDGTNNVSRFYWPSDLAVDQSGNLFVADTFNNTIRKVSPASTNYVTTTICGQAGVNNSMDGTNSAALFDGPVGITMDGIGNLFVADSDSSVIRKITPFGTNWVVNTIGGLAYDPGSMDGTNSEARFDNPYGITVGGSGTVYIADTDNQTIRAGSPLIPLPAVPDVLVVPVGKTFSFNWQAQLGLTYQIQFKTNLMQATWANVGLQILATNTVMPFVDMTATNTQRFYRVMVMQ